MTGGLILEIPGEEYTTKANNLVSRLRELFKTQDEIKISRSIKKTELRLQGLDDLFTQAEVAEAVASTGCDISKVKLSEIRHRSPTSMSTVWLQYTTAAAKKVVEAGKLKVR